LVMTREIPALPTSDTWGTDENPGPARDVWKHVKDCDLEGDMPLLGRLSLDIDTAEEDRAGWVSLGPRYSGELLDVLRRLRDGDGVADVVPLIDLQTGAMGDKYPTPKNGLPLRVSVVALRETVQEPAL